ncbi:hypothetical protein EGS38_11800, partial [Neisseria chenwenguii]
KLGKVSEYETVALIKADAEKTLARTSDGTERTKLVQTIRQADEYLAANKTAYEIWKEGGIGRAALQAGVGGLMTGNASGALAGGTTSLAAPYLNTAAEKLGSAGGTLLNTVGGAAIGYAVGGNVGAATAGANVDWHNRQLHDSEIRKIKNIAAQFAKEQNITEQQATDRLMTEAMRLVDKAYADKYAQDDTAAEAFLRKNTDNFIADGKHFTEFANMGYYNDPSKFAEQHGYSTERRRLYQQPVYTSSQKSAEVNAQVRSVMLKGTGKGIANTPSTLLNAPINWTNEFTHGKFGTIPNAPYPYDYSNEVEAAVGMQTSNVMVQLTGTVIGLKGAGSVSKLPPQTGKVKGSSTASKSRVMNTVDGEMVGGNRPVKLPSNVNLQILEYALHQAIPTKGHPSQLMHTLNDGTRLIFRKDFGSQAHPIGNIFQGKGAINHYNIEVQIPRANGSVRTIENLHIVPNSSGGFTWWGKDGVTKK